MKPKTKISVDVMKKEEKRNDARGRREKGAHFILENKGFGLENEAKKRPKTNITVDVAKKREKNRKCTHTSGTGGVDDLDARDRTEKQFRKRAITCGA